MTKSHKVTMSAEHRCLCPCNEQSENDFNVKGIRIHHVLLRIGGWHY